MQCSRRVPSVHAARALAQLGGQDVDGEAVRVGRLGAPPLHLPRRGRGLLGTAGDGGAAALRHRDAERGGAEQPRLRRVERGVELLERRADDDAGE